MPKPPHVPKAPHTAKHHQPTAPMVRSRSMPNRDRRPAVPNAAAPNQAEAAGMGAGGATPVMRPPLPRTISHTNKLNVDNVGITPRNTPASEIQRIKNMIRANVTNGKTPANLRSSSLPRIGGGTHTPQHLGKGGFNAQTSLFRSSQRGKGEEDNGYETEISSSETEDSSDDD